VNKDNQSSAVPDTAWTSPVPLSVDKAAGTTWQVRRAWPHSTPGEYVLEVLTPGMPVVREPACGRDDSISYRWMIRSCLPCKRKRNRVSSSLIGPTTGRRAAT
jgi:hypothetical protein